MSGCVARRWHGTGTTKEKPTNEALAKEVEDKLKEVQKERLKQDNLWEDHPTTQEQSSNAIITTQTNQTSQTTVEVPVYDKSKTRGF
jgi:hypothetical protein